MSTPATVALTKAGIAFTLHAYERDGSGTSYGAEAAAALGIAEALMFKTLLVQADRETVVAVAPVSGDVDLKAVARAVGAKKAAMADPAAAERLTGYVVGGISPVGQRTRLRTVVDESALSLPTVYVSAGRRGVSLALAPADLVAVTGAEVAAISRS
ncbi:MAG: Cys-tRNA(Pro) deacylase [Myxococcales bacterium]|nr:MAG: Cys-tRNA(Pro) deacylase [Myxococcales bacterium]